MAGKITTKKAKKILKGNAGSGKRLTKQQLGLFGLLTKDTKVKEK